ncbi:hypothetical protein ANOM_008303 [Aspergillus nomiae NRRL 13137]|uniref:HNH nuclease domain-containing protein n=1 Tax=Aspergillus nomiae NRRL (strain ATCC 15546 / NRRL 13137 / CBS 260.88 / M93) TaxID=1509407 RepID=A0A0L1IY84_ASPN3|nr:uncharacterized protein ANOM_008303 [Aspergillus nomiae NRRL 13137]KNG84143.1 hypothetical protein ANOM_008303 [Aspergillus nomiae NRRL 13137]
MASESPAVDADAIPEVSDIRRHELIEKLGSIVPEVESTTWALLWLSDIEQLEDFCSIKRGPLLLALASANITNRRILMQWASRARTINPVKTRKRKRSESLKEMCVIRDNCCVLTGKEEPIGVAHMYPYSMMDKPKTEQTLFWEYLESFWHLEKIQKWKNAVIGENGTEVLQNVLCLSRDSHGLWGRARFTLQPLEVSDDRKILTVRFFWIPISKYMKTMDLKTMPSIPLNLGYTGKRIKLFNCESGKQIYSGDIITITTTDPDEYPLPSFELLEMQWLLTRALALSGTADFDPEDWDDSDSEEEKELVERTKKEKKVRCIWGCA